MIALKGPAVALDAYGDTARRQFVDLDLLIHPADLPRAAELLVGEGCSPRAFEAGVAAMTSEAPVDNAGGVEKLLVALSDESEIAHVAKMAGGFRRHTRSLPSYRICSGVRIVLPCAPSDGDFFCRGASQGRRSCGRFRRKPALEQL